MFFQCICLACFVSFLFWGVFLYVCFKIGHVDWPVLIYENCSGCKLLYSQKKGTGSWLGKNTDKLAKFNFTNLGLSVPYGALKCVGGPYNVP